MEDIKADLVLVSHGHGDHLGDSIAIAKQSGGTVVSVHELAAHSLAVRALNRTPCISAEAICHRRVKIRAHTSLARVRLWGRAYGIPGNTLWFFNLADGKIIYHAGDTGLFGDMELIGNAYPIDLALLPIGDNFTMGPEDALKAVQMLKPKLVVPMHYNTWPLIEQDPEQFKKDVEAATESKVTVLAPPEKAWSYKNSIMP